MGEEGFGEGGGGDGVGVGPKQRTFLLIPFTYNWNIEAF
jgi:hypothetical protein